MNEYYELWADVRGYEGVYQVSNTGKVRRMWRQQALNEIMQKNKKGSEYKRVCLCIHGKKKEYSVHRLVAEAFIPNPNYYPQINHIDGKKGNNRADNLEWCSPKQNTQHAIKTGLRNYNGDKNPFSRLTEDQVREIRKLYAEGNYTYKQLGEMFNIHFSTVGYIIQRIRWAHVS